MSGRGVHLIEQTGAISEARTLRNTGAPPPPTGPATIECDFSNLCFFTAIS